MKNGELVIEPTQMDAPEGLTIPVTDELYEALEREASKKCFSVDDFVNGLILAHS